MLSRFLYFPIILGGLVVEVQNSVEAYPFYIGVSFFGTLRHSKFALDSDYWTATLLSAYKNDLDKLSQGFSNQIKELNDPEQQTSKDFNGSIPAIMDGMPKDLFLEKIKSGKIFDDNPFGKGFSITAGNFCFRDKSLLCAIELSSSFTYSNLKNFKRTCIFSSPLPFKFEENFNGQNDDGITWYDCQESDKKTSPDFVGMFDGRAAVLVGDLESTKRLSPKNNTQAPLTYWYGPLLEIISTLELKEKFSIKFLFRAGTLLKDRFYLYALLGGRLSRFSFQFKQILDKNFPLMYYCYIKEFPRSNNENLTFLFRSITPNKKFTPENTQLICNRSATQLGFVGGIGGEFFINKHLSTRLDFTMSVGPDTLINTEKSSTQLRYSELRGKLSLGVFWRF